ncbi:MAG: hypothetical protein II931_05460 [Clostridia bacterium]|nr:hypothetical protein [Clostridia bacterium]
MAEKKSEHSGHRDRMRKKYLEYGISIFEQHEILEILLFHVISRKDTNTIAHKLIAEFGSLSNVLDASYNSIAEKGFNDDIAFFLSFLPDFFEVYVQDKFQNKHFILNKYSFEQKLIKFYSGETEEKIYLILFDENYKQLYSGVLRQSLCCGLNLDFSEICELVVHYKTTSVIVACNRPNGNAVPSQSDIFTVIELSEALSKFKVCLEDFLLISGNECVSFDEYKILFGSVNEFMKSEFCKNKLLALNE